jgi:dihydrofolate reductase
MTTVTLGMNVSLDGYISAADDDLSWAFANFSPELLAATTELLGGLDTILMGRANYESQAASWPNAEGPLAAVMNNAKKIVFSTTLKTVDWKNATLATGTPEEEIARLKSLSGGPIGVAGGAGFASYLLERNLIDEFRLTIHPVVLGSGIPLFASRIAFDVVDAADFPNGVTVQTLRPKLAAASFSMAH